MDFEDFYQQESRPLLRVCWLATLDSGAAADAVQEAMFRAWQRWDSLSGESPAAWVRAVALNLCRSRWRRLQREFRLAQRVSTSDRVEPQGDDPELFEALRHLPRRQREALVLHYFADLTVDGCARAMGISPGSVKQHLRRAGSALGADPTLQIKEDGTMDVQTREGR